MATIDIALNLALVMALVLLNGFFVAAEFAIVKVRQTQLKSLPDGTRKAAALHVTQHLDAYLSACQLGITLASLGLGWIGEPAIAHLIVEPALGRFDLSAGTISAVAFGVAFAIITILHIVLGELAPKTVAIRKAQGTALWVALPLQAFRRIFSPFIWLLNGAANAIVRLVGLKPVTEDESEFSLEEIRLLLTQTSGTRGASRTSQVAERVFALHDITVASIMTPRDRVRYLDVRKTFEENLETVQRNTYSRFPLCDGSLDSILGFVHYRDVYAARDRVPRPRLEDLRREMGVVHNNQRASKAFFYMLEKRRTMGVVVNEFGTTVGVITLDDLFEEMMGEIPEDFDRREAHLRVISPGHYIVDASMPLHELQVVLREPIEGKGSHTVAGFLNHQFGHIPSQGETVRVGSYAFWVREADKARARTVEVRLLEDSAVAAADAKASA